MTRAENKLALPLTKAFSCSSKYSIKSPQFDMSVQKKADYTQKKFFNITKNVLYKNKQS